MKAVAAHPGTKHSLHLAELPEPALDEIPGGRGVLVRILSLGLDGTDREIDAAEYGASPPGADFLVLGHESLGVVERVGTAVTELQPGDHVVAMVRRPGDSIYDAIGKQDFTVDDTYHEHGINLLHGYLTERYVERPEYLIRVPGRLADVAVLLEPISVAEKGITQAYEIQRRLRVWRPRRAAVLGTGPLGLLATMALRVRGLEVTAFGLERPPFLNAELVEAIGARYVSTQDRPLLQAAGDVGPFDLIFEATGFSPLVFEAMQALGKNGVLVLSSVTGGDRQVSVPAGAINLGFVLGNKVAVGTVNAGRENFESGVADLAITEAQYPGWLARLITHVVAGLESYQEAFDDLTGGGQTIKVVVAVAPDSPALGLPAARQRAGTR